MIDSPATYRIDVATDPHSSASPFKAHITRLSDDSLVWIVSAISRADAEEKARTWISRENSRPASDTLYVGDDGQDAEVPL